MIYSFLNLRSLALSLTRGMDVDAYLMDEWKFDISFPCGPRICSCLECQVTQESSVHHPEQCCPHRQCLPMSPLPRSGRPASLVPGTLPLPPCFVRTLSFSLPSSVHLEPQGPRSRGQAEEEQAARPVPRVGDVRSCHN